MTFLTTAFLIALPLAAGPLVLHLFDRRRNIVIEWGAMEFLLQAATRRTNFRKLRDRLLLLLRILAILLLVLALAQPLVPGHWFGNASRDELILVIDNSLSTARHRDSVSSVAQTSVLEKARQLLAETRAGTTVRILTAAPYPIWLSPAGLRFDAASSATIENLLDDVQIVGARSDLPAALFTATQIQPEEQVDRRRIVVLTDGHAADWELEQQDTWQRFQHVLRDSTIPTAIDLVAAFEATSSKFNLGVSDLETDELILAPGQRFEATAVVRNYSREASATGQIRWYAGNDPIQSNNLPAIDGHKQHNDELLYEFHQPGRYTVRCEIEADDSLKADNHQALVVTVLDSLPVLLVEEHPDAAELQQDSFLFRSAMGFADGEAQEHHGVHRPEVVTPEELLRLELSDYRAVVFPAFQSMTREVQRRLTEFVRAGGGLWLALHPRCNLDEFNTSIFSENESLVPLRAEGIVDHPDENRDRITLNVPLNAHTAAKQLADNDAVDTADVTVHRRIRFVQTNDDAVSVLLNLSNGEPLAVEQHLGSGRVIVQGIPMKMDECSDLTRSHAFVVMVRDWLSYLTASQTVQHNLMPGDPIAVRVSGGDDETAVLQTPGGDRVRLSVDQTSAAGMIRSSRTATPGSYRLVFERTGEELPFEVRRDPTESSLISLTNEQRADLTKLFSVRAAHSSTSMKGSTASSPFWPLLLCMVIALILFELLLSGRIARERFGIQAAADSNTTPAATHFPTTGSNSPQSASTASNVEMPIPKTEPDRAPANV